MKSKVSTQNNDPIYPHLILARGLPFMGGEYSKTLADTYDISISRFCRVIKIFLRTVDSYDDHRILVYVEFMTSHLLQYMQKTTVGQFSLVAKDRRHHLSDQAQIVIKLLIYLLITFSSFSMQISLQYRLTTYNHSISPTRPPPSFQTIKIPPPCITNSSVALDGVSIRHDELGRRHRLNYF